MVSSPKLWVVVGVALAIATWIAAYIEFSAADEEMREGGFTAVEGALALASVAAFVAALVLARRRSRRSADTSGS